jgi:hypothetical protein
MAKERKHDPFALCVFDKTHAVMFFATPHRGMLMDDILDMIGPASREKDQLIRSINQNSGDLARELTKFVNSEKLPKLVSFYEQQKTRRLEKVRDKPV